MRRIDCSSWYVHLQVAALVALMLSGGFRVAGAQEPLPGYPKIAEELPPTTAGLSLGICEPVVKSGAPELAAFGAGCARWLQFAMGENPELGQQPLWEAQLRACKELGTPDLKLNVHQAAHFAAACGYTHVAVGEITGTSDRCTLTFQVYAMPGETAVGAPLKAMGSEMAVTSALPDLARQMLKLLKVASPHLPTAPMPSVTDLGGIGRYVLRQGHSFSESDTKEIRPLAEQQPLAGLLLLQTTTPPNTAALESAAHRLLLQAPDNLEVRAALASEWEGFTPSFRTEMGHNAPSYAKNYAVTVATYAGATELQDQIRGAEHAVQYAPHSPDAWLMLAGQYARSINRLIHNRPFSMITEEEIAPLQKLISRWYATAHRAVELDPEYEQGWTEVAVSALYTGKAEVGEGAIWKAIHLAKGASEPYIWGMQIYQPKWLDDSGKAAKVAKAALEDHTLQPLAEDAVAEKMAEFGLKTEAQALYDRAAGELRSLVKSLPDSAEAHRMLGHVLYQQKRYDEATTEYKEAVRLEPDSANVHYDLGILYQATKKDREAVEELQAAVRLLPQSVTCRLLLGRSLCELNRLEEAETAFRQALQLNANDYQALCGLGKTLALKKQYDAALQQYQQAIHVSPDTPLAFLRRCAIYLLLKDYDKAAIEGGRAVYYGPKDAEAHSDLAAAYVGQQKEKEAEEEYRTAVSLSPNDPVLHLQLASTLLKLGEKEDAKLELKTVLTLKPDSATAKEAQQLLDANP